MVLLRLRVQARLRGRTWAAWAVAVGLAAGVVVTSLAGARRTETSYQRFLTDTAAFDVLVTNGGTTPDNLNRQFDLDELAALPGVASAARLTYHFPQGETPSGTPITPSDLTPFAPEDDVFGRALNRLPTLAGRLPSADDEIAISPVAASRLDIEVGDVLALDLAPVPTFGPPSAPDQPRAAVEVVGIVAIQGGFPPVTGGLPPPAILSPDFGRTHPGAAQVLAVRLDDGPAGVAAFEQELQSRTSDQVVSTNRVELTGPVQRSLDVQASALRAFAVLFALVGLLLAFQALRRSTRADAGADDVWRALGATGRQLALTRLALGLLVAPVAALVAVATAVATSPLLPIGLGRDLEPRDGIELNLAYLGVGAIVVAVTVVALHAVSAAVQAIRSAPGSTRSAPAARARTGVGWSGPGPSWAVAASSLRRVATVGRDQPAAPMRSTIASLVVGIVAVAGLLVFTASLDRLFTEPRLYGWTWDVQVGDAFSPALDDLAADLRARDETDAVAPATIARLTIGSLRVDTLALDGSSGIEPTVVAGAPARTDDQILLGSRTSDRLGVSVGDEVEVRLGDRTTTMRVSGRGVLPEFAGAARLGDGAALTLDGLRRLAPDTVTDVVLVRTRPGPAGRQLVDELVATRPGNIYRPERPADLSDLQRVGGLPFVTVALLAVAGLSILAQTLAGTRRRRDHLLTLRAIGFVRRQVAAVVVWQAIAVSVLAALVGIPLGVAAGRQLWGLFADGLGVPDEPVVPWTGLALLAVLVIGAALLAAAVPAALVARVDPAPVPGRDRRGV